MEARDERFLSSNALGHPKVEMVSIMKGHRVRRPENRVCLNVDLRTDAKDLHREDVVLDLGKVVQGRVWRLILIGAH